MILEITDNKKLSDIRREFSTCYPFLSLEFYDEPHISQETTPPGHKLPHTKTIGEIRKMHHPGMVEIHAWNKTGFVEQEFRRLCGLNVQVMRRHGDTWIQTAGTDELTLEEQNQVGSAAAQEMLDLRGRKDV